MSRNGLIEVVRANGINLNYRPSFHIKSPFFVSWRPIEISVYKWHLTWRLNYSNIGPKKAQKKKKIKKAGSGGACL